MIRCFFLCEAHFHFFLYMYAKAEVSQKPQNRKERNKERKTEKKQCLNEFIILLNIIYNDYACSVF